MKNLYESDCCEELNLSEEEIRDMEEMEEAMTSFCGCGRKNCPVCLATCNQ